MKVIKEMFVHEKALSGINNELYNIVFSTTKTDNFTKPVTVSYEIDQEIKLKESEVRKILKEEIVSHTTVDNIMQRLFGDSNE